MAILTLRLALCLSIAVVTSVCRTNATAVLPSATGKVPIEGSITANNLNPGAGERISISLVVVPLEELDGMVLSIVLPEGVMLSPGSALEKSFATVRAGDTLVHSALVTLADGGAKSIVGRAVHDGALGVRARSFVFELNPSKAQARDAGRSAVAGDGSKIRVYPGTVK